MEHEVCECHCQCTKLRGGCGREREKDAQGGGRGGRFNHPLSLGRHMTVRTRSALDSGVPYDDAGSSAESRSTQRLRVATERWSLFSSAFLSGQF